MNILLEHVKKLSFNQMLEMIDNYKELEENGSLGDCLLRDEVEKIIPNSTIGIILWMDKMIFYCYRIIAEKAMERGFKL